MFILRFKNNIKAGLKGNVFCGNGDEHECLENIKFLSRQSSVQAALCHSFNSNESLLLKIMWLSWYLVHSCRLFSFGTFYVFTKYNDIRLRTDYVRSGVDTHILHCKLRALRGISAS